MTRILLAFLLAGAAIAAPAQAQNSPIPDTKVPAFGGGNIQIASPASGPSGTGTAVGSNVGAGGSAGPSNYIVTPSSAPTTGGSITPPAGTSGSVTVTR